MKKVILLSVVLLIITFSFVFFRSSPFNQTVLTNTNLLSASGQPSPSSAAVQIDVKSNLKNLEIKKESPTKYSLKSLNNDLVELGTERHSPPKPYLKLNKWEGEANLKVSIPYNTTETPEEIDGKLRYTGDGVKVDFYPKAPQEITEKDSQGKEHKFTINEEGGIEFDTILEEKPVSNRIIFLIETQNLDFLYQPPLNEENKDPKLVCTATECKDKDGNIINFRPENVVGSYAVYHQSKQGDYSKMGGKNYKTGKAFHIYRPKIKDASNKEIWGELNINEQNNTLTIVIDQNWLNNAVYPVTIDPTFGYETIGGTIGSVDTTVSAQTRGSLFTGAVGTATKITAYASKTTAGNARSGIYTHSNSTLITNGATDYVSVGTTISWVDFLFATNPSIEAIDYVLSIAAPYAKFVSMSLRYDAGDTDQGHSISGGDLSSPATFTHTTNKYSIYATYTVSATPTPTPEPQTNFEFEGVNMQGVNID